MTKNPYINALIAYVYISLVVLGMTFAGQAMPKADTFLMPVGMISLFTLSAAVMIWLFIIQPFELYTSGEKKGAIAFFIKSIASFALLTILTLLVIILLQ